MTAQLVAGTSVTLQVKRRSAPSPKLMLVNSKHWARKLDRYEFPCTCGVLQGMLCVGVSSNSHVCCLAHDSALSGCIPKSFHYEGSCVWSHHALSRQLENIADHVVSSCSRLVPFAGLDLSDLHAFTPREYHRHNHFRCFGVAQSDVQW